MPAARALLAMLFALTLTGCVDSASPILAGAEPVLGKHLRLDFYSLRKGFAHDPDHADYTWNGALYAHAGGGMREVSAFAVYPFENDFIVQSVPADRARITQYAVMHKLAEGVYLVVPIDEDDADDATREALCTKNKDSACRIETREQLFAFARATAAREKDTGGLVIRLPEMAEPAKHRHHRR
jgi:hypothetical protein